MRSTDFQIRCLCFMTVIGVISAKIDGWDTSPNTQYHIQTDEGPERYFRYQTISGQYRKEKRLQDGTVIGSYGWVDADGYLRLNDYVADDAGYRILRTKRLYVGAQTPVNSAIESSKYVAPARTASSVIGGDVSSRPSYPADKSKFLLFPSSPSSSEYAKRRPPTPPIGYYPTSTPPSAAPDTVTDAVAITPHYWTPSAAAKLAYSNKYAYKGILSAVKTKPVASYSNAINPYYGERLRVAVADRRSDETAPSSAANYDGISVTRNGFRYFLPTQYHEEESNGDDERRGSFGYVDPFGIRRVIYYNASPSSGFVHRKSNRFVGFNAPPYDP